MSHVPRTLNHELFNELVRWFVKEGFSSIVGPPSAISSGSSRPNPTANLLVQFEDPQRYGEAEDLRSFVNIFLATFSTADLFFVVPEEECDRVGVPSTLPCSALARS